MLTDQELTTRSRVGKYVVTINHKRKEAPNFILRVDTPNKAEALVFGNEYAQRILGLPRSEYYLIVDRIAN